jgi:hypothetical protein
MEQNNKQAKFMTSSVWFSEKVQETRYKVAELIAKAKKTLTIGQSLLMYRDGEIRCGS